MMLKRLYAYIVPLFVLLVMMGCTHVVTVDEERDESIVSEPDTVYVEKHEELYIDTLVIVDTLFFPAERNRESLELDEYPYYAYVDAFWEYEEWDADSDIRNVEYYPDFFDSIETVFVGNHQFDYTQEGIAYQYINDKSSKVYDGSTKFVFKHLNSQKYMVSVDKVDDVSAPLLRIDNIDKLVRAIEYNDRWYYPLDSSLIYFDYYETDLTSVSFVNEDLTPFGHDLRHFGVSDNYKASLDFEVTLIVTGKYMGTKDSASVDVLAGRILERLNLALNPGGIRATKINVLYAKDNPLFGNEFPDTEEIVIERVRYDRHHTLIDSLGCWAGHTGEIKLVLISEIAELMVKGFSPQPGVVSAEGSCDDVVVLSTSNLTSAGVAEIAIHELGHFFGLSHTTEFETVAFDDLEDTPFCAETVKTYNCPDYGYIMFPMNDSKYKYLSFTPQQMDVIRHYLSTRPHM